MSAANPLPERDIPLTQIPTELRRLRDEAEQYRQRAALEFTRAEAAERRARHAEVALEDWRRIAQTNADLLEESAKRAGKAEVELARLRMRDSGIDAYKHALDDADRRAAAHFSRADKLAVYIETIWDDEALTPETEHVRALIEEAGVDCEKCGGDGRRWYDDGSDTRHPMVKDECETCFGVGKVIR